MHPLLLKDFVASVRARVAQGDCPVEPQLQVGNLEDAIIDLAAENEALKAESERQRAALQRIEAGEFPGISTMIVHANWQGVATMFQQIARAAVSEGK